MSNAFPPPNDRNAQCLESMATGDCTVIGIKRMGQLDEKPFHHACKRKYRDYDPEGKGTRLISLWQKELKNKSWNPFTTILVDGEEKVLAQFIYIDICICMFSILFGESLIKKPHICMISGRCE